MKKIISIFIAVFCITIAMSAGCNSGENNLPADTKPRVELSALEQVYDGTARYPQVTAYPSDLSDVELLFYSEGSQIEKAVYPGNYTVKAVVKNGKISDVTAEFKIKSAEIDLKEIVLPEKKADGTINYSATVSELNGIVGKDRVVLRIEGRLSSAAAGEKIKLAVTKIALEGDHAKYYVLKKAEAIYVDVVA